MKNPGILLFSILQLAGSVVIGQKWQRTPEYLTFVGKVYNKAVIYYTNGETKSGYAAIPKTWDQKEISFKTEKDAKVTEIPSQVLRRITVINKDSSSYSFERVNFVLKPDDPPKHTGWLFMLVEGYANLYFKIDKYKVDPWGQLHLILDNGLPMKFVQKKGEHKAVFVSISSLPGLNITINSEKQFKKYAPVAFAEDEDLVNKIKNKNYTSKDIEEVVQIYNEYMQGR